MAEGIEMESNNITIKIMKWKSQSNVSEWIVQWENQKLHSYRAEIVMHLA